MPTYVGQHTGQAVSIETFNGAGSKYVVETPSGVLYLVYVNQVNKDVVFIKSTNRGRTWSAETVIAAIAATNLSIWYDRWSDINAGLIHCAYTDSGVDDTLYRSIDTENSDTLSTETTIFAGASTAAGGTLSITRARGGNLYCLTCIDAGAEEAFVRSTDVGATWGNQTINENLGSGDQAILLPGFAADDQDIMCIFWDASADEISRQLYDDSANSWSETSIATSMVDQVASTIYPHFYAAVDLTNSRNVVVAWSAIDTLNADLRCWTVTESAITEVTAIVTNSTDDQGCANIGIDISTGWWYVFYMGKTDGSETFNSACNVYYVVSKDGGSTWTSETQLSPAATTQDFIFCNPRSYGPPQVFNSIDTNFGTNYLYVAQERPRARYQAGIL